MKVVVAIDSLKGSLTSLEAGEAIRAGVLRAIPDAEVVVRPLADGGEGTVEAPWGAREVGSPCEWRGGARHCSRAMVGECGLETC